MPFVEFIGVDRQHPTVLLVYPEQPNGAAVHGCDGHLLIGPDDLAVAVFQPHFDRIRFPTAIFKPEDEDLVAVVHHYDLRYNAAGDCNGALNLFTGKRVESVACEFGCFPGIVSVHEPRIFLGC